MSDAALLLAQFATRTEPATDPAMAVVRLARASIDALVLKLGQTIEAEVKDQLTGGFTSLKAGEDNFVLKLSTALPAGSAVTLKVTQTPSGQPAITVTPQQPTAAAPLSLQPTAAAPLAAQQQAIVLQPSHAAPPAPPPPAGPQAPPASSAPAPLSVNGPVTTEQEATPRAIVTPTIVTPTPSSQNVGNPVIAEPSSPPRPPPAASHPPGLLQQPTVQPAPAVAAALSPQAMTSPTAPRAPEPANAAPQPQLLVSEAAAVPSSAPPTASTATAAPSQASPPPAATPLVTQQPVPSLSPTHQTAAPTPQASAQPLQPYPAAKQQPLALPHAATLAAQLPPAPTQPPLATHFAQAPPPAPTSPPLAQILVDPAQAAARQDTIVPLIAKLAALLASPTAASLPKPMLEAMVRVLASRIQLDRAPPDGRAIRDAVLSAGVATEPAKPQPSDARATLLTLRSALANALGSDIAPVVPVTRRPSPPLKGEPARAAQSQPVAPLADEPVETVRQLLGHTDAAISRLKLLQLASGAPDAHPNAAPASTGPELRVEVPLQLGAETGILQLLVERDGRQKPNLRERGWRMRFALNFTATGEVGAELALFGEAATVALWAAEPATADALEAMLPELASSLASHGLAVGGIRVRRGAPASPAPAPGRLLDSAR